jgi:hypothetical protein
MKRFNKKSNESKSPKYFSVLFMAKFRIHKEELIIGKSNKCLRLSLAMELVREKCSEQKKRNCPELEAGRAQTTAEYGPRFLQWRRTE